MTSLSKDKIALLDSDIICYRVGFASEDVSEHFALARVTELVQDVVFVQLECKEYKAYITGRGNFRNEIAKTVPYKGNRKDMKKPIHYDAIRKHLQEKLDAELIEGMEADDAIAIAATELGDKCIIVSIDKDLDQVAGLHYNFVKQELYEVTEQEGTLNFYKQILTGDRVDQIPGLKGIGPAKATKILKDCNTVEEIERATWKAYQDNGKDMDYFIEQGKLLWLCRYEGEQWMPKFVLNNT